MEQQPTTQQPSYEELVAELDRLRAQQRQLLVERRYLLLAADALSDAQASERERALATYLIRLLRRAERQSQGS